MYGLMKKKSIITTVPFKNEIKGAGEVFAGTLVDSIKLGNK